MTECSEDMPLVYLDNYGVKELAVIFTHVQCFHKNECTQSRLKFPAVNSVPELSQVLAIKICHVHEYKIKLDMMIELSLASNFSQWPFAA